MNQGSWLGPSSPANWPGMTRPVLWISRLGQDHRRRQVVARGGQGTGDRGHRRPVARPRSIRVEARRQIRPARQHDVMAGRVVVRAVRQRTHQRPEVAPLGQARQMLADIDSGRPRGDRPELAADALRRIRLEVEALQLRQSTGEENIDDRPGLRRARRDESGRRRRRGIGVLRRHRAQRACT